MQPESQARLTLRKSSVKKQVVISLALTHTNNHTPKHLIGNMRIAVDNCSMTKNTMRTLEPSTRSQRSKNDPAGVAVACEEHK